MKVQRTSGSIVTERCKSVSLVKTRTALIEMTRVQRREHRCELRYLFHCPPRLNLSHNQNMVYL